MALSKEELLKKQREYAKSRYYWLKSHHICVKCGNDDAMINSTLCPGCSYKQYEYNHSRGKEATEEQKQKRNDRLKQKRKERELQGLCTSCGKNPPAQGSKMCEKCKSYQRKAKEEQNRKKGVLPKYLLDGVSLCARCGKSEPLKNYRVCKKCYDLQCKSLDLTPTHKGMKVQNGFTENNEKFYTNKK